MIETQIVLEHFPSGRRRGSWVFDTELIVDAIYSPGKENIDSGKTTYWQLIK